MADPNAPASADTPAPGDALASLLPAALARGRVVQSPYPFRLSGSDSLRVSCANSLPGVVINVQGRVAVPGGDPSVFSFTFTPTSDRSLTFKDFVLNAGLVTNLTVFVTGAAPLMNQTFVIVQLINAIGAVATVMGTLLAGSVTATQHLGWPGSPIQSSLDGDGYFRNITGTAPGALNEISETVPNGAQWELIGVVLTLTLTNTVAGPVKLNLKAPGGLVPILACDKSVSYTAPNTFNFVFGQGLDATDGGTNVNVISMIPLPRRHRLVAGGGFATVTPGMSGADTYSAPIYLVREWLYP
jgi:hypothetical protein